jgi:hypothetical protein
MKNINIQTGTSKIINVLIWSEGRSHVETTFCRQIKNYSKKYSRFSSMPASIFCMWNRGSNLHEPLGHKKVCTFVPISCLTFGKNQTSSWTLSWYSEILHFFVQNRSFSSLIKPKYLLFPAGSQFRIILPLLLSRANEPRAAVFD